MLHDATGMHTTFIVNVVEQRHSHQHVYAGKQEARAVCIAPCQIGTQCYGCVSGPWSTDQSVRLVVPQQRGGIGPWVTCIPRALVDDDHRLEDASQRAQRFIWACMMQDRSTLQFRSNGSQLVMDAAWYMAWVQAWCTAPTPAEKARAASPVKHWCAQQMCACKGAAAEY
jgi:hypothetical protein